MNVVARTIDEKRCEERFGFSESLSLSLSLSLSASGTPRNEGRQVHRGCSCCMHHRRCTDTPTSSPLLFLRLHASRSSGRGERRGAKRQDKAANSGEKISFLSPFFGIQSSCFSKFCSPRFPGASYSRNSGIQDCYM